ASANIVMAYLQARRLRIGFNGRLDLSQTVMISVRILVVSILTGAIARGVWAGLDRLAGVSLLGQIISVGGAVLVAGGFYIWAISHMRIPEWQQIESMLASRLRPR
ncbi:MAG: hypothetical protein FWD04_07785, partial [Conexibacteraceae bacterium]|nr:hypothetical protein [Conexibacteraceae bacterium]